jgi:DNA-binding IclR family transcriptional regulator
VSRVQSIERAFAVLGALADGPSGVTEVADRVELPKSTAARLLASLAREGAVEHVPGGSRYRLGSRIVQLAATVQPARGLVRLAHPYLVALAAAAGEVAGLSVPDGFAVHYVDQVDTSNPVSVRDWTGTRVPMHAVPSGHVFLAGLGLVDLERFLDRPLERFTGATLVDRDALRERIATVRRDGYAWVRDEFAEGIASVAAGVADASGEIVAAIHVHGPSYRFPRPGAEPEVSREVVLAAARIASRLREDAGGFPPDVPPPAETAS